MRGANAYDCSHFHPTCVDVRVLELGGFAYLWCPTCRILANLQAVSAKLQSYADAKVKR